MGSAKVPTAAARDFRELMQVLETDPYPAPGRRYVAPFKGTTVKNLYVAWHKSIDVTYRVAQDQPVILLVGAYWHKPEDPDDGDGVGPDDFMLAA